MRNIVEFKLWNKRNKKVDRKPIYGAKGSGITNNRLRQLFPGLLLEKLSQLEDDLDLEIFCMRTSWEGTS